MYKIAKPLFLHCQTPLHAGSGDDLGIVDLPIQRERHTGFPKIESSGIKGAIRESFEEQASSDDEHINIQIAFGYDEDAAKSHQKVKEAFKEKESRDYVGAVGFTDARILLFPLKSLRGIFAWVTCPAVLKKLQTELVEICKLTSSIITDFNLKDNEVAAANPDYLAINQKITLEEYCFQVNPTENTKAKQLANDLKAIFGIENIENQLIVLSDDTFTDFVKYATEVVTRIKIDNEKGTVKDGALFTEEYLPSESVMYLLVMASPVFSKQKGKFDTYKKSTEYENILAFLQDKIKPVIQIGGNSTLGKGIVKIIKTQL